MLIFNIGVCPIEEVSVNHVLHNLFHYMFNKETAVFDIMWRGTDPFRVAAPLLCPSPFQKLGRTILHCLPDVK